MSEKSLLEMLDLDAPISFTKRAPKGQPTTTIITGSREEVEAALAEMKATHQGQPFDAEPIECDRWDQAYASVRVTHLAQ